jgi:hypothetical protein
MQAQSRPRIQPDGQPTIDAALPVFPSDEAAQSVLHVPVEAAELLRRVAISVVRGHPAIQKPVQVLHNHTDRQAEGRF